MLKSGDCEKRLSRDQIMNESMQLLKRMRAGNGKHIGVAFAYMLAIEWAELKVCRTQPQLGTWPLFTS